jgi:hypothetical protein
MGGHVSESVRQVLGFFRQGFDRGAGRRLAFEVELAELIAPHMSVLIRRRAKLLADGEHRRWSDTLDCYMRESLWPLLDRDREFAERNRTFVTLMIDVSIERAQRRELSSADVPYVPQRNAGLVNAV